jgi:hypothetical protein
MAVISGIAGGAGEEENKKEKKGERVWLRIAQGVALPWSTTLVSIRWSASLAETSSIHSLYRMRMISI